MIDWDGPKRQPCPECGRGPKDRTCGVSLDERGGVAHCFRCGYRDTDNGAQANGRPLETHSQPSRHETLSDFGRALWEACRPLGGEASAYLQARSCVLPPRDGHLRWHPALKHPPSGMVGPALIALVTDAVTRQPLTLHRTWVRADGSKAPFDPPRMLLGGHRKAGGVIRLWPDEAVTTGLAIAEGIETALSLSHAYAPVWSCIDAGNLGLFPVLDAVESLLIGADNDPAGVDAAKACARRWAATGRDVRIVTPQRQKSDLNDVVTA